MRALVILPSYNESENVLPLVEDILSRDPGLEVLVVDDNSPDGTANLVAAAMREAAETGETGRLHLLKRSGKLGLGSAYQAGVRYGLERGFPRILTMDCDYSHHPRYLPEILRAMDSSDMVIGSRYVRGGGITNWPKRRRILSRFANRYTRVLLGLPVHDCTAGFRCYSRAVLETIDCDAIRSSGYAFLEEMVFRVHRAGFTIREIPIVFEDRTRGTSKINHSEIYLAAWHVLMTAITLRFGRGDRVA